MKNTKLITGVIFFLCIYYQSLLAQQGAAKQKLEVITGLQQQKGRFAILKVSPNKSYKFEKIPDDQIDRGGAEENELKITKGAIKEKPSNSSFYHSAISCSGNLFAGTDRAVSKTHPSTAAMSNFKTINELFNSGVLVSDGKMLTVGITKDSKSKRVAEENHNIAISEAYVYGIYKENDNDFHMIIGNGKNGNQLILLNVEIAGLPENNVSQEMRQVRTQIIARFGDIRCGSGAFKPVGQLMPISIKGSLFFDVDHPAGRVGFGDYKPKTAWEIHPVTGLRFLD